MANKNNKQLPRDTDELLAILASGQYKDGTPFSMPTGASGKSDKARHGSAFITDTSNGQLLIPANPNRLSFEVIVHSGGEDNSVWLGLGAESDGDQGILILGSTGSSYYNEHFTGDVYATADSNIVGISWTEIGEEAE